MPYKTEHVDPRKMKKQRKESETKSEREGGRGRGNEDKKQRKIVIDNNFIANHSIGTSRCTARPCFL